MSAHTLFACEVYMWYMWICEVKQATFVNRAA